MPQEPFNPDGVTNKVGELYALPDLELQAQTDLIRADFRAWMTGNFLLDTEQQAYLGGMDDAFVGYTASQVAFAARHRLPIAFDRKVEVSAVSKLVRTESNLVGSHDPTGTSGEGSLLIEIIVPA